MFAVSSVANRRNRPQLNESARPPVGARDGDAGPGKARCEWERAQSTRGPARALCYQGSARWGAPRRSGPIPSPGPGAAYVSLARALALARIRVQSSGTRRSIARSSVATPAGPGQGRASDPLLPAPQTTPGPSRQKISGGSENSPVSSQPDASRCQTRNAGSVSTVGDLGPLNTPLQAFEQSTM